MDLTPLISNLCEITSPNDTFLIQCLSSGLISLIELEYILSKPATFQKCLEFYTILQRKKSLMTLSNFHKLLQILRATGNEHVVEVLERALVPDDADAGNPTEEEEDERFPELELVNRKRICNNLEYLAKHTTNILHFATCLESLGVLTTEERKYAVLCPSDHHKCIYIYSSLLKKDSRAYDKLLEAAVSTGNEHLIEKLCEYLPGNMGMDLEPDLEIQYQKTQQYIINQETYELAEVGERIWHDITEPVVNFIGRDKELDMLHKSVLSQNSSAKGKAKGQKGPISKISVISGLGGIGKTELARKYAYTKFDGEHVVWINAESTGTMEHSFINLARTKLNINEADKERPDMDFVVEKVYQHFAQNQCLFIFDNAENSGSNTVGQGRIDKFLPVLKPGVVRPFIFVTSRNAHWEGATRSHVWDIISLQPFTRYESRQFTKDALPGETDEDVRKLFTCIKGLPLALNQAVAYIKYESSRSGRRGGSYSISNYLSDWDEKFQELLEYNPFFRSAGMEFQVTTLTMIKSCTALLAERNGTLAQDILRILTYCNSEGVSSRLFLNYVTDPMLLGSVLGLLKCYSLIGVHKARISMHGLLQEIIQRNLVASGEEEGVLENTFSILNASLPTPEQSWAILSENVRPLLSSSLKAWKYGVKYQNMSQEFIQLFLATIVHSMECGEYERGTMLSKEWLNSKPTYTATAGLTSNNEDRMKVTMTNAMSNVLSGEYEEAINSLKGCVQFARDQAATRPEELIARRTIDQIFSPNISATAKVDIVKKAIMDMCSAATDTDSPSSVTLNVIASALIHQSGKSDEAVACLEKASEQIEKESEGSGMDKSVLLFPLAGVLNEQGKNDEALKLVERLASSLPQMQEDPNEIPGSSTSYHETIDNRRALLNLQIYAGILRDAGRLGEALTCYKNVYQRQSRLLGENHPDSICTGVELADVRSRIEREKNTSSSSQAQAPNVQVRSKPKIRNEAAIQLQVTQCMELCREKRFDEAISCMRRIYEETLEINGPTDRITLLAATMFTFTLNSKGDSASLEEALALTLNLYHILHDSLGPENYATKEMKIAVDELVKKTSQNDNH